MNPHDLHDFMKQLRADLASEYLRIQKRVLEDPGTAGDEGEANWAILFQNWLPSNYHIVTKGRIISYDGIVSPQLDILILHPSYPKHLMNKKIYIAGGVVAAFECKLTLRISHLKKVFHNAAIVKRLIPHRQGNPYDELHQPIIFGLLAHSHKLTSNHSKFSQNNAAFALYENLSKNDTLYCEHPREMLDIICVADLATYYLNKWIHVGPITTKKERKDREELFSTFDSLEGIATCYFVAREEKGLPYLGTILGSLISYLVRSMAYEDPNLRSIADYFFRTVGPDGLGKPIGWHCSVLSNPVLKELRKDKKDKYENSKYSNWQDDDWP